jgi:vancomycin resistance protein YoaR
MSRNVRRSSSPRNRTSSQKRRRRRKRLLALAAAAGLVFLFLLAILIDSTLYHGRIHAGVTVAGISLGGLSPEDAKAALDLRVQQAEKSQVTLKSGDKTWTVAPADVGTSADTAASVGAAMEVSRKSNFLADRFHGFLMYFKDTQVPLKGSVDETKVEQLIAGIAQTIDVAPINAGLVFDGPKIKIVKGQKGRVVDQKALADQLTALLLSLHATELQVPMTVKDPTVQADDYDQALQQGMTMTSAPVTLTNGSDSWTLGIEEIIAYMDFRTESQGGQSVLIPYLSGDKMAPFLDDVAAQVKADPVSATFKGDGTRAWVVPGVPGKALDMEKTIEDLNAAVLDAKSRSVKVALVLKDPKLTTDEAKAMGIKDVLGDFETQWVGTTDRQTNVRITTGYASNVILAPGDVYDFNEVIGPRTAERGYKMAPGIVGPGQLEDVFGGGICQVSTTLFNAAFEAGLDIVQRKNHSIYITHYPKGRDATVSANGPNLRFRNDTKHYILIRGASDGVTTKFVIYGTDDGRTVESETSDFYDITERTVESTVNKSLGKGTTSILDNGQNGMKIKVTRVVKNTDGKVIHNDVFVSVWPMLPKEIEVGTAAGTTTTTGKPTTTTSEPTTTTTTEAATTPASGG